ncbi:MAG: hypothetical protein JWQ96_1050 [Segetibacter sp.]|nr:hypothetical protein [Segetibacter sp.]
MLTNHVPSSNHVISLADAVTMTTRYRKNRETVLKTIYVADAVLPTCETFNKAAFSTYMNNEACKAIRIYYGMDEDLCLHAILVGVNEDNEDMVETESLLEADDEVILEEGQRCPPMCPPASVLNEPQ